MRETKKAITPIIEEQRYPDLTDDIELLRKRAREVGEHRGSLIGKWLQTLEVLQKEMRHLERIEKFSSALTDKQLTENITENS